MAIASQNKNPSKDRRFLGTFFLLPAGFCVAGGVDPFPCSLSASSGPFGLIGIYDLKPLKVKPLAKDYCEVLSNKEKHFVMLQVGTA